MVAGARTSTWNSSGSGTNVESQRTRSSFPLEDSNCIDAVRANSRFPLCFTSDTDPWVGLGAQGESCQLKIGGGKRTVNTGRGETRRFTCTEKYDEASRRANEWLAALVPNKFSQSVHAATAQVHVLPKYDTRHTYTWNLISCILEAGVPCTW